MNNNVINSEKEACIEEHPYESFVPTNATILILGSFPGKDQTRFPNTKDEWFYSAKRNQFWRILEEIYSTPLLTVDDKKKLFEKSGIAITDVILKAKRKKDSNLDQYLDIIEYNYKSIKGIIDNSKIETVFFTSKFVQKQFSKLFPDYHHVECLPSPSPRYARMSFAEKIKTYAQKFPK